MTLNEIKKTYQHQLSDLYPEEEIDSFFYMIVEKELGYSKAKALSLLHDTVSMGESIGLHQYLKLLKKGRPIQYLLGSTEFYGLPISVNQHTLIPRPETEELVEWILKDYSSIDEKLSVLDIGTGTGCIAIALSKNLSNANLTAWDISEEALKIAQKNSKQNNVNVAFQQQDILEIDALPGSYDIIVSNPPYVRKQERVEMHQNVLDHEPGLALFVEDENPLVFYEKIASLALQCLTEDGALYFEINAYLGDDLVKLLKEKGFSKVILKKDLFGKDRMIKCTLRE